MTLMHRKKKKLKAIHALTLIELLLAISLFSVISTILYSMLSNGVMIWKRSEMERDQSSEERIILGKMALDIRNAFIHSWIKCLGEAQAIYFTALRQVKSASPPGISRLVKIHYYFLEKDKDAQKQGLYLAQYPIEERYSESHPKGRLISTLFKEFHIKYGYWDSTQEKVTYRDKWNQPEKLPRIVLLEGRTTVPFSRMIVLPLGEMIELDESMKNKAPMHENEVESTSPAS